MSEVQKFRKRPVEVEVMGPTTGANAAQIATWAHKSMPLASFFGWYVVKENETFELVSPAKFEALYESAPVPAPRMEWREVKISATTTRWFAEGWEIGQVRHFDGTVVYLTRTPIAKCESPAAAKSLAEKLNDVLSPPVGPQPKGN